MTTATVDHEFRTFQLTAPVLSSFLNLFEAKAVMKNGKATGEPKFSINLEFPNDSADLKAIKGRMMQVAKLHWPGRDIASEFATKDAKGNLKSQTFIFPLSPGDKAADKAKAAGKEREWSRGRTILTSRTTKEPTLSVIDSGRIIELDEATKIKYKAKFFSGVEVLAEIYFKPYEGVGVNPDGVTAYLNMVLSTGKGTKLTGGKVSSAEVFKGYIGTLSNEDPTGGFSADLDDEIPF